jgi:hypothetical protein
MYVGSNPSCVERNQGQQTGRVSSMANQLAALALDEEGCVDHEFCYGNVSIVLGATAADGAVRWCQQTGRASWTNLESKHSDLRSLGSTPLIAIPQYVQLFMQLIIYTNNGWGVV